MSKISVIVPVYNVEKYLDRCVESIIAQSFADFELILVDDGSPDNSPQICDEWAKKDNRIKVIHQQNGGLSVARNSGIDWVFANSNSEWITFIDSDDWVLPQMFEALYNAAKTHCVDISICDYYTSDKPTPEIDVNSLDINRLSTEAAYEKRCGLLDLAVAKLYRKELFKDVRYPKGLLYEDAWTTYKVVFSVLEVAMITEAFYCYYVNPESITNSNWSPKWLTEIEAHEMQLHFFYNNNYMSALQTGIKAYIWVMQKQLIAMKNCRIDTKKYEKDIYRKLRKTLTKGKKYIPDKMFYNSVWEFCHPKLSLFIGAFRSAKRRICN